MEHGTQASATWRIWRCIKPLESQTPWRPVLFVRLHTCFFSSSRSLLCTRQSDFKTSIYCAQYIWFCVHSSAKVCKWKHLFKSDLGKQWYNIEIQRSTAGELEWRGGKISRLTEMPFSSSVFRNGDMEREYRKLILQGWSMTKTPSTGAQFTKRMIYFTITKTPFPVEWE